MPIRSLLSCLLLVVASTSCSRDPNFIKADAKSVDGHRLKGRLLYIMADDAAIKHEDSKAKESLQNAIAEFKTANALKPDQSNVVVYLARTLTANNQLGDAEKLYRSL